MATSFTRHSSFYSLLSKTFEEVASATSSNYWSRFSFTPSGRALVDASLQVGEVSDCGVMADAVMWHVKPLLPIGVSCGAAEELLLAGEDALNWLAAGEGAIAVDS